MREVWEQWMWIREEYTIMLGRKMWLIFRKKKTKHNFTGIVQERFITEKKRVKKLEQLNWKQPGYHWKTKDLTAISGAGPGEEGRIWFRVCCQAQPCMDRALDAMWGSHDNWSRIKFFAAWAGVTMVSSIEMIISVQPSLSLWWWVDSQWG